jgi:hypothetical protein
MSSLKIQIEKIKRLFKKKKPVPSGINGGFIGSRRDWSKIEIVKNDEDVSNLAANRQGLAAVQEYSAHQPEDSLCRDMTSSLHSAKPHCYSLSSGGINTNPKK